MQPTLSVPEVSLEFPDLLLIIIDEMIADGTGRFFPDFFNVSCPVPPFAELSGLASRLCEEVQIDRPSAYR